MKNWNNFSFCILSCYYFFPLLSIITDEYLKAAESTIKLKMNYFSQNKTTTMKEKNINK